MGHPDAPESATHCKAATPEASSQSFTQSMLRNFAPPQSAAYLDIKRKSGEPVGIRTRDLLIKSQLLYQLSYRPT